MFVKMFLRDRVVCFIDSVGMTPLACLMPKPALRFRQPQLNCFLRVCLPTLFAAVLKLFLPKTTSAFSGAAISDKSVPTYFAAGTTFLHKNGLAILPITCESAPNPLPRCRTIPPIIEPILISKRPSRIVFPVEMNVGGFSKHRNKTSDTDRYERYFFHFSCLSRQRENYEKNF